MITHITKHEKAELASLHEAEEGDLIRIEEYYGDDEIVTTQFLVTCKRLDHIGSTNLSFFFNNYLPDDDNGYGYVVRRKFYKIGRNMDFPSLGDVLEGTIGDEETPMVIWIDRYGSPISLNRDGTSTARSFSEVTTALNEGRLTLIQDGDCG